MSKRKDIDWAWASMTPVDPETEDMLETAWELGRIAGIREAARMVLSLPNRVALQDYARKLARRLK